jgi:hypothetical protein
MQGLLTPVVDVVVVSSEAVLSVVPWELRTIYYPLPSVADVLSELGYLSIRVLRDGSGIAGLLPNLPWWGIVCQITSNCDQVKSARMGNNYEH